MTESDSELLTCALAHIDIGPRIPNAVDNCEALMRELLPASVGLPGVIDTAVIKRSGRGNHFELISRFAEAAAYSAYLESSAYREFRAGIAPANASPYWDRIHMVSGEWPAAAEGDLVVIAQFDVLPTKVDEVKPVIARFADAQGGHSALIGQVLLQRIEPRWNLEVLSVWESLESFEDQRDSDAQHGLLLELAPSLIAPVEQRTYRMHIGAWFGTCEGAA